MTGSGWKDLDVENDDLKYQLIKKRGEIELQINQHPIQALPPAQSTGMVTILP